MSSTNPNPNTCTDGFVNLDQVALFTAGVRCQAP